MTCACAVVYDLARSSNKNDSEAIQRGPRVVLSIICSPETSFDKFSMSIYAPVSIKSIQLDEDELSAVLAGATSRSAQLICRSVRGFARADVMYGGLDDSAPPPASADAEERDDYYRKQQRNRDSE